MDVKVKSLSCIWLFATPWIIAYQASPSMGFSREECQSWVALSFSRRSSWPRDQTLVSSIAGRCFTLWATREDHMDVRVGLQRKLSAEELMLLTLESPLDCKEIQPIHPKGNQSWIFIGRTNAEAETPILWLPDVKNWLIWKDTDAGKDWS